jgi:hypothetical protein
MRQRRKKLTTTISRLDRRVRNVELKGPTGTVTSTAAVDPANDIVDPVISITNNLAPNSWVRVTGGWYYPQQFIGQKQDRIEYYHEGTIDGLDSTGTTAIRVSGAYADLVGIRASNANKSSDDQHPDSPLNFAVLGHNYPTGATRDNYPWYEDVPDGMQFEVCSPNVDLPVVPQSLINVYLLPQPLVYRSKVVSVSATPTHGTVVFDSSDPSVSPHYFKVGDVLSVSDLDAPFSNGDGIVQVTAVATTSITFKFQTALADPISSTVISGTKYVYAVMQKYTRIGSTWIKPIDGGTDQVYVWDGVRYVTTASAVAGTLIDDGVAPSPPTIVSATVTSISDINAATGKIASVKITLEAPTTNEDDTPLDDLFGYTIKWRTSPSGDWTGQQEVGPDLEHTLGGLTVASTYYIGAYARDYKRLSAVSNIYELVIAKPATEISAPSAPTVAPPRLGTVSITWNGNNSSGIAMPLALLKHLEVHASTTSGFTPGSGTLKGYISSPGGLVVLSDLLYGVTYWVKFIAVDLLGNKTSASTQTSTGTIKALVDTDVIGKVLSGANIMSNTITASDSIIGNTITGGLIQALAIDAGKLAANSIIATKIAAGSIDGKIITGATVQTAAIYNDTNSIGNYTTFSNLPSGQSFNTVATVGGVDSYVFKQNINTATGEVIPFGQTGYGGTWTLTGKKQRIVLSGNEFKAFNSSGAETVSITGDTSVIRTSNGSNAVTMDGATNAISFSYSGSKIGHLVSSSEYGGSVEIRTGATPTSVGVSHLHVGSTNIYAYIEGGSGAGLLNLTTSGAYISGGGSLVHQTGGSVTIQSANVGGIILGDPVQPTTAYVASGIIYNLTTSSAPNMWVATSTNGYKLYRSTNPSSRRFKRDIRTLTFDHEAYTAIEPIVFKYNEGMFSNPEESTIDMLGFIAEDFEAAGLESLVIRDEDGELSGLRYDKMVMFLHSIVSEQSKKIAALEAKTASI